MISKLTQEEYDNYMIEYIIKQSKETHIEQIVNNIYIEYRDTGSIRFENKLSDKFGMNIIGSMFYVPDDDYFYVSVNENNATISLSIKVNSKYFDYDFYVDIVVNFMMFLEYELTFVLLKEDLYTCDISNTLCLSQDLVEKVLNDNDNFRGFQIVTFFDSALRDGSISSKDISNYQDLLITWLMLIKTL